MALSMLQMTALAVFGVYLTPANNEIMLKFEQTANTPLGDDRHDF